MHKRPASTLNSRRRKLGKFDLRSQKYGNSLWVMSHFIKMILMEAYELNKDRNKKIYFLYGVILKFRHVKKYFYLKF